MQLDRPEQEEQTDEQAQHLSVVEFAQVPFEQEVLATQLPLPRKRVPLVCEQAVQLVSDIEQVVQGQVQALQTPPEVIF